MSTRANFNAIMRVNALGVMIVMQEVGRRMIEQGEGGKIINTASIAGRQGYAEFAPYCASKAAVDFADAGPPPAKWPSTRSP